MNKRLFELAAEIVHAQAAAGTMSAEEIESVLSRTFNTLYKMQRAEEHGTCLAVNDSGDGGTTEQDFREPLDPSSSIQEDKVICLECGAQLRQLTANHLSTHQLTPREYKKKWGFRLSQSLSAKALTKLRSRAAKKRGLPTELQKYQESQRNKKEEAHLPEESSVPASTYEQ